MMHEPEKSDPSTVASKPANKSEGSDAESVERREGAEKGAEFTVILPLECTAGTEAAAPDNAADGIVRAVPKRCILIADDNRDGAEMLKALFELDGHDVHLAHDGAEALGAISRVRPQIAILDIGMPGLNGYELATRIRAQPWGQKIMLIAVTGWGGEEHQEATRAAGFNHHFTKPVDASMFANLFASPDLD